MTKPTGSRDKVNPAVVHRQFMFLSGMGESLVRPGDNLPLTTPPMIARAGAKAGRRFFEFFTANIRGFGPDQLSPSGVGWIFC